MKGLRWLWMAERETLNEMMATHFKLPGYLYVLWWEHGKIHLSHVTLMNSYMLYYNSTS